MLYTMALIFVIKIVNKNFIKCATTPLKEIGSENPLIVNLESTAVEALPSHALQWFR